MAKVPDLRNSTLRGVQRPADRRIIIPGEDQEEIDRVYGPRTPRTPVRLQLPQADMQEQLRSPEPPVRKAANDLMEEYIAQLAPQNVRNVTAPSSMPYIKTPSEKRADEMLMQRLGNQLSPNDMRFFLEGNYGYSGV